MSSPILYPSSQENPPSEIALPQVLQPLSQNTPNKNVLSGKTGTPFSPLIYPTSDARPPMPSSQINRTPSRRAPTQLRSDIGTPSLALFPSTGNNNPTEQLLMVDGEEKMVIWGTTVEVDECKEKFREFLLFFKKGDMNRRLEDEMEDIEDEEFKKEMRKQWENVIDDEPFYPGVLADMKSKSLVNLNLDCQNLKFHSKKLYNLLIRYPQEMIPVFDYAATEVYQHLFANDEEEEDEVFVGIRVRPFNLGRCVNMRQLDPNDIDQLVTVKGLLIRGSPVIPDMKVAFFRCSVCGATVEEENDRGRIREPTVCRHEACGMTNTMVLVHNRCIFSNKQVCKVQETPDETPDGQTPYTVSMFVYDELVDVGKPGDRLEVTAIFRAVPVRVNPRQRSIRSVFRTYLDVVHVKRHDSKRLQVDNLGSEDYEERDVTVGISEEEENMLLNISQREDVYDLLSKSVAPGIFGLDDVKKGALLQLFGGSNKKITRGDINVLLVGDPGVSKSQLLQYVHQLTPRGIYTSGKGSSAVGLTAYVTRDPDTKQIVLESGALVLSDGGICCIDEFDKMSDQTRSVLHEVMEQQTISIAKAGIITTLNARTSILASANPINSKFDPSKSVVENINLDPPLLSRFDLIFLLLDKPNEESDMKLAQHIVSLYSTHSRLLNEEFVPVEIFTKYISYAKSRIFPRLSEAAGRSLCEYYLKIRRAGKLSGGKSVTGTTRQLESMIRLSEAHAKMRLSPVVEVSDVDEAFRLIQEAVLSSAVDPLTGMIDIDLIQTGFSSKSRDLMQQKRDSLKRILVEMFKKKNGNALKWVEVYHAYREEFSNEKINEKEFDGFLSDLADTDFIRVDGKGMDKYIRRVNF